MASSSGRRIPLVFQTGDVVWGPHGNFPSWPGKLVSAPQSQPSADGEAGTSITHVDCIQNSWIQTKFFHVLSGTLFIMFLSNSRGVDYLNGYSCFLNIFCNKNDKMFIIPKKTSKTGLQRPAARYDDGIGKIGGGCGSLVS